MPKMGLVSRSLPRVATMTRYSNANRPTARSTTRNVVESTVLASQAGAVRPLVCAAYRGTRQASASTPKETATAMAAPSIASSGEMGRSCAPPRPWARVTRPEPSATSADFELDDHLVEGMGLDLDHAGRGERLEG